MKLKVDKTRFKCNVTAGSSSSVKTDLAAFGIAVSNRLGALNYYGKVKERHNADCPKFVFIKNHFVLKMVKTKIFQEK